MAHEGEQRARVGGHAHERGKDAVCGLFLEHVADTLRVVAPPPRRPELHLTRHALLHERSRQHGELRVRLRIEREEDRARQRAGGLQAIEESCHDSRIERPTHPREPAGGPRRRPHARRGFPQRPHVQQHRPSVRDGEGRHRQNRGEAGLEARHVVRRNVQNPSTARVDALHLGEVRRRPGVHAVTGIAVLNVERLQQPGGRPVRQRHVLDTIYSQKLHLHLGPGEEGVSHELWQRAPPGRPLLGLGCVACDQPLWLAADAHCAVLVGIGLHPHFVKRAERLVLGEHPHVEVVVPVDDRQVLRCRVEVVKGRHALPLSSNGRDARCPS